ncbi:hypothetical protein MSPP1_003422 [Malassezia sp. CBS 17886]|nr:hypothetical protein MSPP1_003422 [Malassezia sp. CBS 17886]
MSYTPLASSAVSTPQGPSAPSTPLDKMQDITRLSTRCVRILGQNPSKFTLNGTNTYLLTPPCDWNWPARSQPLPAILVDTGDVREDYAEFLECVLRGGLIKTPGALQERVQIVITDIILTHWHHDHVGGVPFVLRMLARLRTEAGDAVPLPRIRKFVDPATDPSFLDRLQNVPLDAYEHVGGGTGVDSVIWPLRDNETIRVVDPENKELRTSVRAIYTPGHAADHSCLLLEEDNILCTGDNVLGRGSTVFEDLVLYLRSLQRCAALLSRRAATPLGVYGMPLAVAGADNVMFPGHGPVIARGRDTLARYMKHRLERDEQLLALLTCHPADRERVMEATAFADRVLTKRLHARDGAEAPWTLRQLIGVLYANYALDMYPAVARGLLLHLQKLAKDPAAIQQTPFFMQDPLPSSRWTKERPMVRSLSVPSFQRTASAIPDFPQTEKEWWEVLEVPWTLA